MDIRALDYRIENLVMDFLHNYLLIIITLINYMQE
uniref:Uncharacterized protein n=1 Tax=Myoviridae sp. ctCo31 TaxID=2825053 RepID=A0A8S5UMH5_9CAUD|nr:MAG TPA: hypothetical protein [Myoviridae sp. ctCo31]